MKINVQFGRDSGVNPEEFLRQLEEWALEWLDIEEELEIETTLEGESHSGVSD